MCYAAQIESDYTKLVRQFGAIMDFEAFVALWLGERSTKEPRKSAVPKALEDLLRDQGPPQLRALIEASHAAKRSAWQTELFAQRRRLADAQRQLATKPTKTAANSARIAGDKVEQLLGWLGDLSREDTLDRDRRIYPGMFAPVLCVEGGRRLIRPMRYQCRPAGTPAAYDRKYPGTYNARRDNLENFWRNQFGRTHGLLVAHSFFEHVEGADGKSRILEFTPGDNEPVLIACLWSRWSDPAGQEGDLISFAAITDDPEPEVAAAGHDRTVINIRPEHVDAWLNPDPSDLASLYRIFDDKQHPHYEHRVAA